MKQEQTSPSKTKRISYWIATVWLSLGMVSTGIVQLIKMPEEVLKFTELGYPIYLMTFLGVCKILGVVAVLLPLDRIAFMKDCMPTLRQWAYAGFFFNMVGAAFSHIAVGSPFSEIFPSLLLLVLTLVSWCLLPSRNK